MMLMYPVLYVILFSSLFYLYTFFENKRELESSENNEDGKVSILIPAYNKEAALPRLLRSLLNLNYPDKEIVVIDDGSDDKTCEIAKTFKDEGVKVYRKENGGKASALNYGLEKCSGRFLFTADADCVLEDKETIHKMLSHFEDPKIVAVVPSLRVYKPEKMIERMQAVEYILTAFIRKMLSFISALNVAPGAPMYRASFLKEHGGFDENTCTEDLEIGLRIQSKDFQVGHAWDTKVLTVAPNNLKGLYRQRIRWGYGSLENITRYKHLIGIGHGDLGTFHLPSTLFFAIWPAIFITLAGLRILYRGVGVLGFLSVINYDIGYAMQTSRLSLKFSPLWFLVLGSLVTGIITYYFAREKVKEGKLKLEYIGYVLVYGWLLAIFQIVVLIRYALKKKPEW